MRENVLGADGRHRQRRGHPHRHAARKKSVGRLRPDAAVRRQRRHARRDDRDHAAAVPAARGDVGGDLHLPEHRRGGATRRSRSSRWACRSRAASCSTRNAVRAVNRHDKLALREAPMLLMEFHGSDGRRRRSRSTTVQEIADEHGGEGFQWATHARGAHAAVDGAPPRLLRRPADEARLPHRHDRHLRADLAPGRVPSTKASEEADAAGCRTTSSAMSATATSTSPT